MLVRDPHAGLHAAVVRECVRPGTIDRLRDAIRRAASLGDPVALSGGRHAMGGQPFLAGRTLLDLRGLDRIISMDHQRGTVTAEAGIQWPALVRGLLDLQRSNEPGREPRWGIIQKQTGADDLTLGGAVSANIHGRGLRRPPFVNDLESLTVVDPRGDLIECSRTANADLFRGVVGGYGLFGAVATVTLRLAPRRKLRRVVRVIDIEDAAHAAQRRIDAGFTEGDFQFDIDPDSPDFLTKGVFSCYEPVSDETPISPGDADLSAPDWIDLLHLAHVNKREAFSRYAQHYLATDGRVDWSDLHQLGVYPGGYHVEIDRRTGAACAGGEMITEVYVPPERLIDFLRAAADMLARRRAPVIYGTIRLIQPETETMIPWARRAYACVIFNLHVERSPAGAAAIAPAFTDLIDLALERGGSFYLTYHRFATRRQVLAAYPEMPEFIARKRAWDPRGVFSSDWWRWLVETIEGPASSAESA